MQRTDLHTHTIYSDGYYEPEKVVSLAHKQGIEILSITDHDNVNAIPEATKQAKARLLKLVSGNLSKVKTVTPGSISLTAGPTSSFHARKTPCPCSELPVGLGSAPFQHCRGYRR